MSDPKPKPPYDEYCQSVAEVFAKRALNMDLAYGRQGEYGQSVMDNLGPRIQRPAP